MGEHLVRNEGVVGSNPIISTIWAAGLRVRRLILVESNNLLDNFLGWAHVRQLALAGEPRSSLTLAGLADMVHAKTKVRGIEPA